MICVSFFFILSNKTYSDVALADLDNEQILLPTSSFLAAIPTR